MLKLVALYRITYMQIVQNWSEKCVLYKKVCEVCRSMLRAHSSVDAYQAYATLAPTYAYLQHSQ